MMVDFHDVIIAGWLFGLTMGQHVLYIWPANCQGVAIHMAVVAGVITVIPDMAVHLMALRSAACS